MKQKPTIRCVDMIAARGDSFVVIERLSAPLGLAFPGGKIEAGETPVGAIAREFGEETGFSLEVKGVVGFYDDPTRDHRGRYVSTVMHGVAFGVPREESGKTRVHCMHKTEIMARHREFVSDHFRMFIDYVRAQSV